jgi:hypothetical protein
MRVTPWLRRPGRKGERGVTAVLTAICLTALCAVGALAVDLGNTWQTRRNLITASDAGALAAAQRFVAGGDGCATVAATYVGQNTQGLGGVTSTCTQPTASSVRVDVQARVDHVLARVFGSESGLAGSTTVARWGHPTAYGHLRPFAVCWAAINGLLEWAADPDKAPQTFRIRYSGGQGAGNNAPGPCFGAPGNWEYVDFDGGSSSSVERSRWIRHGWDGLIEPGEMGVPCPDTQTPSACLYADTGIANNSQGPAMAELMAVDRFVIPLFDSVTGQGTKAQYHVVGFAAVRLVGYRLTGNPNQRYIDLELHRDTVQGPCCAEDPPAIDTGLRVVEICSVDPDDTTGC